MCPTGVHFVEDEHIYQQGLDEGTRYRVGVQHVACCPGYAPSFKWRVEAGSSFAPHRHASGHRLAVLCGTGRIKVRDDIVTYAAGDTFDVYPLEPHCLVAVFTDTVVHQTHPLELQRRRAS